MRGIEDLFRSGARRQSAALALVAAVAVAGIVPSASAASVEYDYTGADFTSVTCLVGSCTPTTTPTTSNQITGDIVIDGGFGASSSVFDPTITSFFFTDGVNTISSSNGGTISTSFFRRAQLVRSRTTFSLHHYLYSRGATV